MEIMCRRTHALASGLRMILTDDEDLDYWDAVSCFDLEAILHNRHGQSDEADGLFSEACALMEKSLTKQPDEERRKELEAFKAAHDLSAKKK